MLESLQHLIKLPASEEEAFARLIQTERKRLIRSPKETAAIATRDNQKMIYDLLSTNQISKAIILLRQLSYDEFLKEESIFNGEILGQIGTQFQAPKVLLKSVSESLQSFFGLSQADFVSKVSQAFGAYAGAISPYIYQLCLSNTQSRRSRAGKVFEGIIYFLYEHFDFTYDSQSSIGNKTFTDLKLGKVVDSILPSTQAFTEFRTKTIVGSMKTTLRERWQEVVEEVSRSNLPNIYLLTVDEGISESKAEQMAQHNIVLVVLDSVKAQAKLMNKRSIIDFETYFLKEIPKVMDYWRESK